MMEDCLSDIFQFDVETYSTLIDCRVNVECTGEKNYSGRVYTIDPLTQRSDRSSHFFVRFSIFSFSIVLIDETANRVHIVLRPDIIQLKILEHSLPSINDPFFSSTVESTETDQLGSDRLDKVRMYLSSKRIPFQEKFEENQTITLLIQNGIVQIKSPYTSQTISGTNEIVLSRIKFLLKQIIN